MDKAQQLPPFFLWANRHAWLEGLDLDTEFRQARDEGRDLSGVEAEFRRLLAFPKPERGVLGGARDENWRRDACALMDRVQTLPFRGDYAYDEPSDLSGIRKARPAAPGLRAWKGSKARFLERLHGGWLGRICGCLLGKPVEGWRRRGIRIVAEATGNWPLGDYWRAPTPKEKKRIEEHKSPNLFNREWHTSQLRGHIDGMVEDDDTNYTTIGFGIVKRHGAGFTPQDVASFWGDHVPIFHTCTAERVAYRNFVSGRVPPESATFRNPYREWIGAQIRADYFGYANPGNPERAAEWAWRDACISHIRNGIYGEMFVAAALAAAYVEDNWVKIIRAGLAQVPAKCRLAEDLAKVLNDHAAGVTYEEAVERLHKRWNEDSSHDWCHTNSNAQIVALGLLYGADDYTKTIACAVMPGLDTDCNGATAGSLWGIKHGVKALPKKWTAPIRDHIRTGVAGYHDVKVSKMAQDMVEAAETAK